MRSPRTVALVAGIVGGAWIIAMTSGSYFGTDEHVFFAQARELPFGWHFLSEPIYDHFSPWHRLLDHVMTEATDLGWWLAVTISLVWFVLAVALFARLVHRLAGDHPAGAVVIALFALSPVFVQATQWWALSAQLYPQLVFTFATLLCALRWQETRRPLWALAAVAAYALALCAFIKALLALPLVALVLYLRPDAQLRPRRDWPLWAGLAAATAVYAVIVTGDRYYRFIGDLPDPGASLWLKYFAAAWGEGVAPLTLGATAPDALGAGNVAVLVVANLLVVAVIAAAVRVAPRTWRVWAGALAIVLAGMLMSGKARLAQIGAEGVALDVRYNAEGAVALLLAAAMAGRAALPSPRRWVPAGVALVVLAAGFGVDAGTRLRDAFIGPENRAYFDAFAASYTTDLDVIDQVSPQYVVPVTIVPWNLLSSVLPERVPEVRVGTGEGRPATVTFFGEVVPVRLRPVADGGSGCGVRTIEVGTSGEDVTVLTLRRTGSLARLTSGVTADSGVPGGQVVRGFRLPETVLTPLRMAAGQRVKRLVVGVGPVRTVTLPEGLCADASFSRFPLP